MILTGIADEAGNGIDRQIEAHKELGWDTIELRLVDGKNVAGELPDAEFERVAERLEAASMTAAGFASAIGNWARNIADDFARDVEELTTAIPRMRRLGATHIRTMSWVGEGADEDHWHTETVRRYRELARIAADGGVYLAHENCTGWGGLSGANMRRLLEEVDSEHLVVLYDTGNTVSHGQEPWEFYTSVKDLIRYVHVKDCRRDPAGGSSEAYAYCGTGDAQVSEVLTDLLADGYDGTISIEPHVSKIVHQAGQAPSEDEMYASYLKYARMFQQLVERARPR